ncbi:MAG: phosphoribosylaminoimidazolesuccinocarboxamide synthase [Burkholderiales bacterium]|nr:phosphoribosylaminoimidazolesuccinocarboxamide synthase [Phycisphaerae bacterium]
MTSDRVILETSLPFPRRRGKVRDVYDLGEHVLIVATDRISAFDCVMPNGIPQKGEILTKLSLFWFEQTSPIIENHIVATDVTDFPKAVRSFGDQLIGRSILAKKTRVIPVECVARGYLAGSGWKEYQQSQTVCGVTLPPGLRQCDRLPESIFTPASKAETGHDENINYEQMSKEVGDTIASHLRDTTLAIYRWCADHALNRGVIIADTKFEFGQMPDGRIILIDEILTPDSSRFWPADEYEPGHDQPSYDKQFVRNWLEHQPWDKSPPAPMLPDDVVAGTRARYVEAYEKLTGKSW